METIRKIRLRRLFCVSVSLIIFFLLSTCKEYPVEPIGGESGQAEGEVVELSCFNFARRGRLVDFQLIAELTKEQIQAIAAGLGDLIKCDIKIYKVSYLTEHKGNIITASGAIGIPVLPEGVRAPMLVYNHGTMVSAGDLLPSSGMDIGTIVSTAAGCICFAPDYIGFGDSEDIFHPFLINESSDAAVGDMIIAGRRFLFRNRIIPRFKLFMYGFSQGGLVTMAAQRAIENDPFYRHRIRLTAVAAVSGPYGLHDLMVKPIIVSDIYPAPALLVFAAIAYNEYYDFGRGLDEMFKNSYGQLFLELIAQNKGLAEVNSQLPIALADLLQDEFRASLIEETSEFNVVLDDNNTIDGWVPQTPLKIYHSPADPIVFYANAEAAYSAFVAAGAPSVELVTLPPVDHGSSVGYALFDILPWFESFVSESSLANVLSE